MLPGVSDTTVSEVTGGGATVEAEVTPGFGDTVYLFEYGLDDSYGKSTETSDPIGSDNSPHAVSEELIGLTPGVTYRVRAVAINFGGVTHGTSTTFTTPKAPGIDASFSSGVTQTAATLKALINPGLSATTYHFEYGISQLYGTSTAESGSIGADTTTREASATVGDLAPGTTYHFRVVATNAVGSSAGPDQTFTTAPQPTVIVQPPPSTTCRKGFVKKKGRCVKRKRPNKRRRHHQRHGNQGTGDSK
jgi:hypothetical protein